MTTYEQDPENNGDPVGYSSLVPTKFAMYKQKARDKFIAKNKVKQDAQKEAVAQYQEQYSISMATWTFDKLEQEVRASDPGTKNIVIKRNLHRNYLREIGPQKPSHNDPAKLEKELACQKYKEETIDPFEKETRKVKAQIDLVKEFNQGPQSKFVGKWNFAEIEKEVEESKDTTKNIVAKRNLYKKYLQAAGPQLPEQGFTESSVSFGARQVAYTTEMAKYNKEVIEPFDKKTQEVAAIVAAEKSKPNKFTSFVEKLTSKPEAKGGAASPSAGTGKVADRAKKSEVQKR